MASQHATLTALPRPLAEALRLALALTPGSEGQKVAQREMVVALETALDARRERIIVSESRVNWAKWTGVVLLAALILLTIALVHSERRATTVFANGIFASAVAVCLADDRVSGQAVCRPLRRQARPTRAGHPGSPFESSPSLTVLVVSPCFINETRCLTDSCNATAPHARDSPSPCEAAREQSRAGRRRHRHSTGDAPPVPSRTGLTERRRSRTDRAWGCATAQV